MDKKVLVAIDDSDFCTSLVNYALSYASQENVEQMDFIHVAEGKVPTRAGWNINFKEIEPSAEEVKSSFLSIIDSEIEKLGLSDFPYGVIIKIGEPSSTIVEVSEQGSYDLILIGHKGLNNIERFLIGSVASNVVRYAPCSVYVYRPKD